jgi:hypothetical protein
MKNAIISVQTDLLYILKAEIFMLHRLVSSVRLSAS